MNIVIVDDQASARTMLRQVLQDIGPQLDVFDFGDSSEALSWCADNRPDLLVLDYRMPGMDGVEFARRFRDDWSNRDVPIILVTVIGDEPVRQAALDAGVIDYLLKPVRPRELRARCRNLLQLRQQSESMKQRASSLEQRLLASMSEVDQRERETLSRLARAIEFRDSGTSAFLERMSRVAGLIAEAIGLGEEEARLVEMAAPLHDIGKIAMPDALLLKPGRLTGDERAQMMTHPRVGYELLQGSENRFIQVGAVVALRHHERYDGSGYPDGLAGEDIPLQARVVTVADVFDALISKRPYKEAWTVEDALDYLRGERGRMFDPVCIDALLDHRGQLQEICTQYEKVVLRPRWIPS